MEFAADLKKLEEAVVRFMAPKGFVDTGLFVGGGWVHAVEQSHPTDANTTVRVVTLPAAGNWEVLHGLGFTPMPSPPAPPENVATD